MQRNNEVHWFLIWLLYSPKKLKMYLEHSSGQLKLFNAFMNQTNRLLVWFMIYNFKVNYSKDNFFFPIILKDTTKRNTERRWETILINSRQSKKKRITHVPEFGNSGTKHSFIIILIYQNQFIIILIYQNQSKKKKRIPMWVWWTYQTRVPICLILKIGRLVPSSRYQSA